MLANARVRRRARLQFVPQMELAECGAACLNMVLRYHGHHASGAETRDRCAVSRDGADAYSIAKAAESYGLGVRALRLDTSEPGACLPGDLPLPAIAHWQNNHFVVIAGVGRDRVTIYDPAAGRRRISTAELMGGLSGLLLAFTPGPGFARKARSGGARNAYWDALKRHGWPVVLIYGAAFLLEIVGVVVPAASQVVIDLIITPRQGQRLWILALVLLVATGIRLTLKVVRDQVTHGLNQLLDLGFMTTFIDHLMKLPLAYFQRRTTADLLSRVSANLELKGFWAQTLTGVCDAFVLLSYAGLMLAYDPSLAIIVLGLNLLRLTAVSALQGRARTIATTEQSLRGKESATALEALSTPELRLRRGVRNRMLQLYAKRLHQRLDARLERRRITEGTTQLITVFDGVSYGLLLWVGGQMLFRGQITVGVFAAFLTLTSMLERPLQSVVNALKQLGQQGSVLARSDDILETPPEKDGPEILRSVRGRIQLEEVGYWYRPGGKPTIDRLSLAVAPGEKIGIVGVSGAGKSTLGRLMLGLVEPTSGVVRVDGVDLRRLDKTHLRRHCGVVLQDTFLLDMTIRDNIALRCPDLTLSQVRAAAQIAGIDEVIERLPDGYNTMLGENGHRFSGGERQRLAIARAVAGDPGILFFDEATSALDLDTEARVQARLAALGCTRIVVAHRLATVRDADRIFVLDEGRLVQEGSYRELSEIDGLFRDMVRAPGSFHANG
jgi:ATP-binding cassette subfamily B protein